MAFPTVSLLDSFKRAEEKPLKNGEKWIRLDVNKETSAEPPEIGEVFEESYRAEAAFATKRADAYWKETEFSNPNVVATVHVLVGNERFYYLYGSVAKIGVGKFNGYRVVFEGEATAGKYKALVQKFKESGAFETLAGAEKTAVTLAAGDLIGLSVEGGKVKAWHKSGAGAWETVAEATDSTYNKGFVGIGMGGNIGRLQNFEAGSGGGHKESETFAAKLTSAGKVNKTFSIAKTLTAVLSFRLSGVLPSLQGVLRLAAQLPRQTIRALPATLSFAGSVAPFIPVIIEKLTAALSFLGVSRRNTAHQLLATLPFTGALSHISTHTVSAGLSFAGILSRQTLHQMSGSLSSEGKVSHNVARVIAATLSSLGLLDRNTTHEFTPQLTFAGIAQRITTRALTAALTFFGSLRPLLVYRFEASMAFAGTLQRNTTVALSALLTFSTRMFDHIIYGLMASLDFEGTLTKRFALVKTLVASLTSTGALGRSIVRMQMAKLNFAGSIASRTTTRTETASLSFTGALRAQAIKALEATLAFAGTSRRNIVHALSAELTFFGFLKLTGEFVQKLTASLNFTGNASRSVSHTLGASVTFSGELGQSIVHGLAAALGAEGSLQRAILHQLAAVLAPAGSVQRETYYKLVASVTFTGAVARSVLHELRASVSPAGSLEPGSKLVQLLTATLSFSGQARRDIIHTLRGALSFVGSINFERAAGTKPLADSLVLKQEGFPTLTLRRNEAGDVYGLINHLEGFPEMEVQSIVKKRRVFGRRG